MARGAQGRRNATRRSPLARALRALALLLAAGAAAGAAALLAAFWVLSRDLPRIDSIADYRPPQVVRVLDRHGETIGRIAREQRTVVPIERVPRLVIDAVLAAEDADFFRHRGLDYPGILRALWARLRHGRFTQGASTITQQVVKTFLLSPERTLRRKMREMILARRLEQRLRKEEILWLYLNQIYFGHGRYGVEEAARFYFGRPVDEIDLAQAALLAGLPQAPELLSPLRHPERARARRGYVLDQLLRHRLCAEADARVARDAPLVPEDRREEAAGEAPEVVDAVREQLVVELGEQEVAHMGGAVRTTLDLAMQRAARAALERGLAAVDRRRGFDRPARRLRGAAIERHLARLRKHDGPVFEAVVVAADDRRRALTLDLGAERVELDLARERRLALDGEAPSARFAHGDVLRVRRAPERGPGQARLDAGPQGALVALDHAAGEVRALVGGYRFSPGDYDRALRARRQPGSAFKAIVYAAAIESRRFTPASVVSDSPEVFGDWKPGNFETEEWRGPVRLRVALRDSLNSVAIKLAHEVGTDAVIDVARRMGIESPLDPGLSLALGASAVTPMELAGAMAAIASGGRRCPPRLIVEVAGEARPPALCTPALAPEVAYLLADLLRTAVQEGTGRAAAKAGRPAAGKTGTTNEHRDAWFAGFTPELTAAVWVGFDEPRPLGRGEVGGRTAAPIWAEFMAEALRDRPVRSFPQPPGVVVVRIDPATGLLARPETPGALDEVFLAGTEPADLSPLPAEVDPESFLLDQLAPPLP